MRPSFAVRWILLILAVGTLAAASTLKTSSGGGRCKTTPCTYFTRSNQPVQGTCGAVKHDAKNCYCIDNADKSKHQVQAGCSVQ